MLDYLCPASRILLRIGEVSAYTLESPKLVSKAMAADLGRE